MIDREMLGPQPVSSAEETRFTNEMESIIGYTRVQFKTSEAGSELSKIAARDRMATYKLLKRFKVPEAHRRMIFE